MKLFILLSRIPWPLEKGDKLRAFHQIRHLSDSAEIILCALNTDKNADKQQAFRALQPYCKSVNFIDLPNTGIALNVLKAWLKGKPIQTGYFYNRTASRRISSLIEKYQPDLLYGQLLRVAEYVRHLNKTKVLDYQDVFSMGMKRRMQLAAWPVSLLFGMEYRRLLKYESEVFADFDLKTIISEPDRSLIPHPERENILVVPNGVDHDFFRPVETVKKVDIVFTGNMAYPPNVNAAVFLCNEIMPLVWKRLPRATVLLAGATPDKQVLKLQSDKVKVSGWMDDIRTAYAEARVFIAPMRIGTGLQNKLLEAMSMKLPCVTTPLANDPLKAAVGNEILVGQHAAELAEALIKLLENESYATKIADSGYHFVLNHYHWAASTHTLLEAMTGVLAKKSV